LLLEPASKLSADVIVIGAGVAGTTAASVLARQGRKILLLDARPACPPVFKAEKVECDELRLLDDFGLLSPLLAQSGKSSEVYVAYEGRVFRRTPMQQIGIPYSDLVNTLRSNLPATVETKFGRVNRITHDNGVASAHLDDGRELTARLVVVACGVGGQLLSSLGLRRNTIQKQQCVGIGFDMVPANGHPFPFQAVTYYPTTGAHGIDYLTLFKIRHTTRANLFLFRPINDSWIKEFHHQPRLLLQRAFPKLSQVIGDYRVAGKVVSSCVDLFSTEGNMPDGVVLIGDALQTACPSTGLGVKKVLTDVSVLAECAPAWFSTPGMSAEKLQRFYDHPRKRSTDAHAMQRAIHQRKAATSQSLRWRLYRALLHLRRNLATPIQLPAQPQMQDARLRPIGLNRKGSGNNLARSAAISQR
jgi:2-polyprenyl-6-methoxyphenol hydroxylase-like FAD-dependent oxidoreductase